MEVPTVTALADVYPAASLPNQKTRWKNLIAAFEAKYGRPAEFVSRSPGRANIIGEHIDYSLYEVLPMAITADVIIAVAVRPRSESPPQVLIANTNEAKYPARQFEIPLQGDLPIDSSSLEWSNYFRAGVRGASELLAKTKGKDGHFVSVGLELLVDGTVPSGGGLSSSAAFVCASALAVLKANAETHVDKKRLTEVAIVCERAAGVQSGGMDQAASVFPTPGSALYVSFKPTLTATPITFPATSPPLAFLVAQSYVAADKHLTAPVCYNLRVVECTLAAACLASIFGLPASALPSTDASPLGTSLRGLHDAYFETKEGVPDNTTITAEAYEAQLGMLLELVDDYLPQTEGYTRAEIAAILGISEAELRARFFSTFEVRAERFALRQRALHVFGEARRVLRFRALLDGPPRGADGAVDSPALTRALGDLLNETQDSCRELYECSCPELDELCALARGAGAVGSRLTGAGWGGCSVHLVPEDKLDRVRDTWIKEFYNRRYPDLSQEKLEDAIVVSKPGSGSCVYFVKEGEEL